MSDNKLIPVTVNITHDRLKKLIDLMNEDRETTVTLDQLLQDEARLTNLLQFVVDDCVEASFLEPYESFVNSNSLFEKWTELFGGDESDG